MEELIYNQWMYLVASNGRFKAYDRIKAIREFWRPVVFGKTIGEVVAKFKYRAKATDEQVELRETITISTTRSVCEKIFTTYREVDRCDEIKEEFKHASDDQLAAIINASKRFFGDDDIDYFNNEYLLRYAAFDPNAFQLTNIKPHDPNNEKPEPYPSIISSLDLRAYHYEYNELQYVAFIQHAGQHKIEHLWTKDAAYRVTPAALMTPEEAANPATIYVSDIKSRPSFDVHVWDPNTNSTSITKRVDLSQVIVNKTGYYVTKYNHNLGFVPAKQFGWLRDFEYENGHVFESFLLPAKEKFMELYDKKASYDVILAVHGIYKQISVLPECNYVSEDNEHCTNGYVGHGDHRKECPKCEGSGNMPIHRSSLDVITIDMPMDQMEDVDVSKMHHTVPIEQGIIEMHRDTVIEATKDVALTLFNSNTFKRAELVAATATEVLQKNKSVDNALHFYGQHKAKFKMFQLKCIATYLDFADGFEAIIKTPADYKLETEDELYQRRSAALESGAGHAFLSTIDDQILQKQNRNNPEKIAYVRAVNQMRPFSDVTEAERLAMFSLLPPTHLKRLALLYFDDVIFKLDSEKTTKDWYTKKPTEMKQLFNTALEAVIEMYEIEEPEPEPVIDVPIPDGDDDLDE